MADAFISYAREDQAFVRRVFDALKEFGRETWVDWEGIAPSAVWMAEVRKAIEAGDAFVFVITPDSLASSVCREEVAHAVSVNKRLIPILRCDVGDTPSPEAVAARNWIFLRDEDDFDRGIDQLIAAIATDPEWTEQHTRLLVRARDWEQRGRPRSLLLRGEDLSEAERWLATASGREPDPTPLHAEYIVQSRRAASKRQRLTLAGVGVALAVSLVLSAFALIQRSTALHERERAELEARTSRSRELAAEALGQIEIDPELGVLLAVEAVKTTPTAEAESALRTTLAASHVRATLTGHQGTVSDVVYSPDGSRLLSIGFDQTARLWDAATGAQLAVLQGHEAPLTDGAFAPDGTRVATASEDGTVRLWGADGNPLGVLPGNGSAVTSIAFSPDDRVLVSGSSDGTAHLWDPTDGSLIATLDGRQGAVVDVAAGPDRVATAGADGTVLLWGDDGELRSTLLGHRDTVTSVTFSTDGAVLLSTSEDGTARLWSVPDGRSLVVLEGHTDDVVAGAFSPDGTLVATAGYDGTARVWDAASGRPQAVLPDHEGQGVSDVAFSPDGSKVVTAGDDATARIWSAANGEQLSVLRGHTDEVLAATFDPTGSRVATASGDGTVKVWDAAGSTLAIFSGHRGWVYSAVFDATEERVATAGRDGTARIWDAATGRQLDVLQHDPPHPVTYVSFLPDGEHLITAGEDPTIRVWDLHTGKVSMALEGQTGAVVSVSEVHPDGVRLMTGGTDGTARLWDLRTGRMLAVLPHGPAQVVRVGPVVFSPDGTLAATGTQQTDATVRIWDITAPEPSFVFQLEGHEPGINTVEFSADGKRLLTAGSDLTPRMWDVRTGKLLTTFEGHTDGVTGAVLTEDGYRVLTWSDDGTARIWDARTGEQLHVLQPASGEVAWGDLSPDGTLAVVGGKSGLVQVWDVATGAAIAEFTGHAGWVFPQFNSDGTKILTAADDGTARIFSCELCRPLPELLELSRERLTRPLTPAERDEFGV